MTPSRPGLNSLTALLAARPAAADAARGGRYRTGQSRPFAYARARATVARFRCGRRRAIQPPATPHAYADAIIEKLAGPRWSGPERNSVNGRKKVTVVGAGNVGATCAQELARR